MLTFTLSQSFLERWLLTLSNAGILVVTLVGMLVGKPFVAEFAAAEHAPDVAKTELFGRVVQVLGWVWVATFAAMTVSSAVRRSCNGPRRTPPP